MTQEELEQLVEQQNKTISDLEAERNSLRTENEQRKESQKKIEEELRKTKELNFTLARNLDSGSKKRPLGEIISEAFK